MASYPADKTFDGVPLGSKIRGSIKNQKTYRVVDGVQEKMNYYTPTNPQTGPQQTHRARLTEAVGKWQDLTEAQKKQWNDFIN